MNTPPGWTPQPSGRDPLQPFGAPPSRLANQPPPPPVDPSQYASRTNATLIWAVVAAVVIIAGLFLIPTIVPPAPSSSPTPTSTVPEVLPTIPEGVNGIPWESGDATGIWQIERSRFDENGLLVTMTLRVDKGSLSYDWFAFDNTASSVFDPEYSGPDSLRPGTLNAGESATGTVRFGVKRGPTTIILSTGAGRQVTALLVKP